jgi:D-sedoheptulose 7-phosphate isomerase
MMGSDSVRRSLEALSRLALEVAEGLGDEVEGIGQLTKECLEGGGRLFFCGNGGSAADAQHLAAEYVVRFDRDRKALPAVALTTDTSILTAGGNDFGFESIFSRQVEALASRGDVLFLHSTSGESENLLRAAAAARSKGVTTVAFLAKGGGRLEGRVDRAIVVPTDSTARAQEIHLALGHAVCEIVEHGLSRGSLGASAEESRTGSGRNP